jgi:Fe-S-cluster containining protein
LAAMESTLDSIGPDTPFRFACDPGVACFNECCRDLNQSLTPYDVLRLKRGLGMSSRQFLDQYTRRHTGPGSGLPVVTLKPGDPKRLTCPLTTPDGCRVYRDRPSSCRTYPLVRVLRRSRENSDVREEYRLLREPHCRGFDAERRQTVHEWTEDQELRPYNAENDRLLELISLKARLGSKALPPSLAEQVFTALYDLDRLRLQIQDGGLAGMCAELMEDARGDEVALLRLGVEWVKRLLEMAFAR